MKKYKVHIEEMLEKDVVVYAENPSDAKHIIMDKIKKEEIILTADDFGGWRFIEAYED